MRPGPPYDRLVEEPEAGARRAELASLAVALSCLVLAGLFAAAALLIVPSGLVFWVLAVVAVLFAACCVAAFARYFRLRREREVGPATRNQAR